MTAGTPQHRGTTKDGHHPEQRPVHEKAAIRVGASGVLAEIQTSTKADAATGTMVKHTNSADNTEGVAMEGKEKTQGRDKGTEKDGVAVRDTKENASEQTSVKDFVVTEKKLSRTAPPPQQPEREPKLHIQEEHRGEHQGLRS